VVGGVLIWSAAGTGASVPAFVEGLPRMGDYFRRLLPAPESPWPLDYLPEIRVRLLETIKIALAASFVGALLALPFALMGARNLAGTTLTYNLARGYLNLLRTIPDLVLATLLASAFGIGPFAGLLALIIFTFGVVAKLLSDTIETVDPGPMEAITAAGGTRLQRAVFAVVPQVAPDFVAYALYSFEINVRVAAVLGLVGAGGIGQILLRDIRFFRYGHVGLIIAATFLVVFLIDSASTWLRRRLV
jgi:phosphonate transport system permease protein